MMHVSMMAIHDACMLRMMQVRMMRVRIIQVLLVHTMGVRLTHVCMMYERRMQVCIFDTCMCDACNKWGRTNKHTFSGSSSRSLVAYYSRFRICTQELASYKKDKLTVEIRAPCN